MVVVGQWWQVPVTEHILSSDFDLEMLHPYKLFAGISFNVRSHMKKIQWELYINLMILNSLLLIITLFPGDIPLHIDIRETSDSGKPIVISQPDSPQVILIMTIIKISGLVSILFISFHKLHKMVSKIIWY